MMTIDDNLPLELQRFYQRGVPQSLLIKGESGTGKTTLALEILDRLSAEGVTIGIFTRMDREDIINNLSCVSGMAEDGRLVIFDKNDRIADPNLFEKELEKLEGKSHHVALLFDTVDAVLEKFEKIDSAQRKIRALLKTLKGNRTHVIFVQEDATATDMDYTVDAIVTLSRGLVQDKRMRRINIDKLRGVEIMRPSYLITLDGGQFCSLPRFNPDVSSPTSWEPVPDPTGMFSTGTSDLDRILGGGFRRGSYNVFDIDDHVTSEEYFSLIRPIILNFLTQARGVTAVLTGGDHPSSFRSDLVQFMPEEQFDGFMRIADYFQTETDVPYIMPLGTNKEEAIRLWTRTMTHLRGDGNRPLLDYTGFDTLEYLRGETIALRELLNGIAATKVSQDLGLGIIKPGLKLTQSIRNMADTYLKIIHVEETCCVYGIKPKTNLYAITIDSRKGFPYISLKAIV